MLPILFRTGVLPGVFAAALNGSGGGEPAAFDGKDCFLMWKKPGTVEDSGAINKFWGNAEEAVRSACKTYEPNKRLLKVKIPAQKILSNGFKINGIEFYFSKGAEVSAELVYKVPKSGPKEFQLASAAFFFSRPVLAYCNFKLNLSVDEVIDGVLGRLTKETLSKIVENISIEPYDKGRAGAFRKPMAIAFDRMEISDSAIRLKITLREYLRKGWGVFSFGTSEKDCTGANTSREPSFFLGDGYGGEGSKGECRSILAGPRFGKPMVKWLMKVPAWKELYTKYRKAGGSDTTALAGTVNFALGSGITDPSSSWDKIANEEALLGSGFNIWKNNNK